jgi:hypothetical protein
VLIGCRSVSAGRSDRATPIGSVDVATAQRGGVFVAGWAGDGDTTDPILVHAYVDGVMVAQLTADGDRPDVARTFPTLGARHGFAAVLPTTAGTHDVCLYGINDNLVGPHNLLGCRRVDVGSGPPTGFLDAVTTTGTGIVAAGWAADADSAGPIPVHVYVDGQLTTGWADGARPDVAAALPALGPNRGFRMAVAAAAGPHQVCVYAINDNLVGPHNLLGCRTVTVLLPHGTQPIGALDVVSRVDRGHVLVAGWAADPDTADPIPVHVYVGTVGTFLTADQARPDVAAALPAMGPDHGFRTTVDAGAGAVICVYAINDNHAASPTLFACRRA